MFEEEAYWWFINMETYFSTVSTSEAEMLAMAVMFSKVVTLLG